MAETQTLTLTAFLLARIAEDEDAARIEQAGRDAVRRIDPSRAVTLDAYRPGHPARVLAECAAKRHIITRCSDVLDIGPLGDRNARAAAQFILFCLAQPYLDHVDYREEWRP